MASQPGPKFIPHKEPIVSNYVEDDELVTPDKAQKVIMDFLLSEIGPYVEFGFMKEREKLEMLIDEKIASIKMHIDNKISKVTEEIIRDMKKSNVKLEIITSLENKLKELKAEL